jgi:hypothetical protein
MNELAVVANGTDWSRLKAFVLDSVSSPITKRVYNLGLDRGGSVWRDPISSLRFQVEQDQSTSVRVLRSAGERPEAMTSRLRLTWLQTFRRWGQ